MFLRTCIFVLYWTECFQFSWFRRFRLFLLSTLSIRADSRRNLSSTDTTRVAYFSGAKTKLSIYDCNLSKILNKSVIFYSLFVSCKVLSYLFTNSETEAWKLRVKHMDRSPFTSIPKAHPCQSITMLIVYCISTCARYGVNTKWRPPKSGCCQPLAPCLTLESMSNHQRHQKLISELEVTIKICYWRSRKGIQNCMQNKVIIPTGKCGR